MAGWRNAADKGQEWATDRLLSRPALSSDAEPYWAAFLGLARDRPRESISMGMGGSLMLPRPIPRETIRREAHRLGWRGDELEDFTEVIALTDDFYVEVEVKRIADEARMSAERARKKR